MAKFGKGKNKKQPSLTFGPPLPPDKKEFASIIGQAIAAWSDVEIQMALLLSILMKADAEPAVAVYHKLRRGMSRMEALEAAAKISLVGKDYDLFKAIMVVYESAEKERNALAHGYFGITSDAPDVLLWVDTEETTQFVMQLTNNAWEDISKPPPIVDYNAFRSKIYFYRKRDLELVLRQILHTYQIVLEFNNYLRVKDPRNVYLPTPAQQYARLCGLAPIREVLDAHRRARAQKTIPLKRARQSKPSLLAHGSNFSRKKAHS
jgi:hypothetical protein